MVLIVIGGLLGLSEWASAHARWKIDGPTPPRDFATGHKIAPCGDIPRTQNTKTFIAGDTLTVEWEETINHPGYFRILFSPANDEGFENSVLLDNIPEVPADRFYQADVQLPTEPCEACTLQLIQVMLDNPNRPYYYSCSDIRLIAKEDAVNDSTPAGLISNLTATPASESANLTWKNPKENFLALVLVRSLVPLTVPPIDDVLYLVGDSIGEGLVVYNGSGSQFMDSGLSNGTTYYYTAFSHNTAFKYEAGVATEVFVTDMPNEPPQLELFVLQGDQQTLSISPSGGPVIVQMQITDPNPQDTHTSEWRIPNMLTNLNEQGTGEIRRRRLLFTPRALDPGTISFSVTVTDNGTPPQSQTATLDLEVIPRSTTNSAPFEENSNPEANTSSGSIALNTAASSGTLNEGILLLLTASWWYRQRRQSQKR
ncbi:MAG: lytic polysaccharide monooxygenase [Gammaproteobacteria bacterium]